MKMTGKAHKKANLCEVDGVVRKAKSSVLIGLTASCLQKNELLR